MHAWVCIGVSAIPVVSLFVFLAQEEMIKLQQLQNTIRGKRTEVCVSSILGELVGAEEGILTSTTLELI